MIRINSFKIYLKCVRSCSCNVLPANYQFHVVFRKFSVGKTKNNEGKLTVEILPEIDNLLKSGAIKHRKHPGVRLIDPLRLPEFLKTGVEKLISEHSESSLLEEAEQLCNFLSCRRLPVEKHEIEDKILSAVPDYDGDFETLSKILEKQKLKDLKKKINLEVGRWKPIEYNYHKCLVYLVGRLASNYASAHHVFNELKKNVPSFKPLSYFDFGSGIGSSLWAAHNHWSDSIKEYFCIDTSTDMIDMCSKLVKDEDTEEDFIKPIFYRQFLPASDSVKHDLVVSAFSLLELSNAADRLRVIDTLWRKTKEFLVVIEYGTVAGFQCVLDARDFILQVENNTSPELAVYSSGAHVISPCPHDLPCPKFMEKYNSTCGFSVPYCTQFPQRHSQVIKKDWISYVIMKKGSRQNDIKTLPRIVKPVLKKPRHVICRLCCSDGKLKEVTVTKGKHGRDAYRCARVCQQGDILPAYIKSVDLPFDE